MNKPPNIKIEEQLSLCRHQKSQTTPDQKRQKNKRRQGIISDFEKQQRESPHQGAAQIQLFVRLRVSQGLRYFSFHVNSQLTFMWYFSVFKSSCFFLSVCPLPYMFLITYSKDYNLLFITLTMSFKEHTLLISQDLEKKNLLPLTPTPAD